MEFITGNCGSTQPAKMAVTPWAQGPTTRAPTGQPRSFDGWLPAGYCAGLLVCTIQYFDFDFTVEGKSSRLIVIKNNIFISTGREEEVDIWML